MDKYEKPNAAWLAFELDSGITDGDETGEGPSFTPSNPHGGDEGGIEGGIPD